MTTTTIMTAMRVITLLMLLLNIEMNVQRMYSVLMKKQRTFCNCWLEFFKIMHLPTSNPQYLYDG